TDLLPGSVGASWWLPVWLAVLLLWLGRTAARHTAKARRRLGSYRMAVVGSVLMLGLVPSRGLVALGPGGLLLRDGLRGCSGNSPFAMNPTCMRVGYDRPVRQGAELQELGKRGRRCHVGEVIELRGGEFRARIDRTGAGLQELTWRGRHVVWPYTSAEGPVAFQGQVLAPWPNRVRDGVYEHNGAEHHLKVNDL